MTGERNTIDRGYAALSGVVGAAVAIGLGELMAGLVRRIPSPLAAVGRTVVDLSPPALEDVAISLFGTADKGALAIGTTVIALVVGFTAGRLGARRLAWGLAVFAAFGLLGISAGLREPLVSNVLVVLATTLAVVGGAETMRQLLRRIPAEEPTDGLASNPSRRRFLGLAAAGGVTAIVAGGLGRRLLIGGSGTPDMALPPLPNMVPEPGPQHSVGLAGVQSIVVPNDQFYRIDTALIVPRINVDSWDLRVHGMVDNELRFTYDDLLGMDLVEDYVTISCVSNNVGGDLVGNARWTGVRLVDVLERAGVQPGAGQIVGRSVDRWTAGFPTELAFDGRDGIIAVAMNGDPLPYDHGFPVRLIIPGLYGYVSATKWLTDIQLTTWEGFNGYWIPRGWAKEGPIKTQSRIDVPRRNTQVAAGTLGVGGVAWAPLRGIERVETQLDAAEWVEAEVSEPLSSRAWVQWKTEFDLAPGRHEIAVRATDGTGEVQTELKASPRPDGASGHHRITVDAV